MDALRKIVLCFVILVCSVAVVGCGKKADENKPISEVKTEAETMNVDQLRSIAMTYKDAILAKKGEMKKVAVQLKDLPVTKMLSDEAKSFKTEIDNLNKSVSALSERFKVYLDKLKEKDGDLTGLKI